jgi:hypothetical protein
MNKGIKQEKANENKEGRRVACVYRNVSARATAYNRLAAWTEAVDPY